MTTFRKLPIFRNTCSSKVVTESGIVTDTKDVPLNAPIFIIITELPIDKLVIL